MTATIDTQINDAIKRLIMVYLTGRYDDVAPSFADAFELLEQLKADNKLSDEEKALKLEYIVNGAAIVIIAAQVKSQYNKPPFNGTTKNFNTVAKPYAHELGLNRIYTQLFRNCAPDDTQILDRGTMAVNNHLAYASPAERLPKGDAPRPFDSNDYKGSGFYNIEEKPSKDLYLKLYQTQERNRLLRKIGRTVLTVASGFLFLVPLFVTIPWLLRANAKDNLSREQEDIQRVVLNNDEYITHKRLRKESRMKSAESNLAVETDIHNRGRTTHTTIKYSLDDLKFPNKPPKTVRENKQDPDNIELFMDKHQLERFKLFQAKKGEALTPDDLKSYAKHSPIASCFTLSKK